jgi:hypothetical protein
MHTHERTPHTHRFHEASRLGEPSCCASSSPQALPTPVDAAGAGTTPDPVSPVSSLLGLAQVLVLLAGVATRVAWGRSRG